MEYVQTHIWFLLLLVNYTLALIAAIFILLQNRNPITTLSYIFSLIVFPFVSLFFYYYLGQQYRKNKLFQRKKGLDRQKMEEWENEFFLSEKSLDQYEDGFLDEKVNTIKLIQHDQKNPLTFNNRLKILIDGEEKFEALFKDIEQAEHHVHLEYYIFYSDDIGTKLIDLLCEKAREGVMVRINYDDVGSSLNSGSIKKLRKNHIEIFPFLPVRFPRLARQVNFRNHRKIVVIDGKIGYVGGINICDDYLNPPGKKPFWRDTHLRICGDAVKTLQTNFLLNWSFVSGGNLEIKKNYFPELEKLGSNAVQITTSGPDSDHPHIMEVFLTAIHSAEDHIYIQTPYFAPNDEILTALKIAARRGVKVRLMLPKEGDSKILDHASQSYIQELMESGLEVYFYQKGFLHSKTMVIDGLFSTLGSTNMDYRSFDINLEINALIYNANMAKKMTDVFMKDLEHCQRVELEEWKNRTLFTKLKESLCRLWAPLL